MKTLINKANPQIRITAPDETVKKRRNCWAIWYEGNRLMLLDKDDWTLVEEEPEKLTWEDAQRLYLIWRQVSNELDACSKNFPKWSSSTRDMFEEILKRFYEQ